MPCPRQRLLALRVLGLADADGVSPLGWLLSEYLESVELPHRATGRRATFGSCVRRLTQLLVHVDPGGPEPEETRAAGESGLPCRGAGWGLLQSARLWPWGSSGERPMAQRLLSQGRLVVMPQQWPCLPSVPSALLWQVSVQGLPMGAH